jgi:hypothetical protein
VLKTLFVLCLGISPFLIYLRFRREWESQARQQLQTASATVAFTRWQRPNLPPDAEYIEGVGYLIGDITCRYNARSSYIRCAVNPEGPCKDCRFYESKEEDYSNRQ